MLSVSGQVGINLGIRGALVQMMAWHRTDKKPLSDPIMVQFTDASERHFASMSSKQQGILWFIGHVLSFTSSVV